jgi:hypothetical protein
VAVQVSAPGSENDPEVVNVPIGTFEGGAGMLTVGATFFTVIEKEFDP